LIMTKTSLLHPVLALSACLALLPGVASAQHHGHGQHGAGPQYGPPGYETGRSDAQCRQDRRTAGTVGGLLGAGAGGAAGRALAASGVRPEGVVLGVVVGGLVGNRLGREAVYCPPADVYTQSGGRSYGEETGYREEAAPEMAPAHGPDYAHGPRHPMPRHDLQPEYAQPAYAPQGYQAGAYGHPTAPAPHLGPAQPPHGASSADGWYTPSPASYYGRERGGPVAPVATWSSGYSQSSSSYSQSSSYSYGPVLIPAPGGFAPSPSMPCGPVICR
jgi:hypothetical protein